MATTPVYGLPYQTLTDPPHGPDLGRLLAEAIEDELARIDAQDGPRGYVTSAERTTDITATTTEILADSVTFTSVAGRRYRSTWDGAWSGTAGGESLEVRLRYAAGASVSPTSTLRRGKTMVTVGANFVEPLTLVTPLSGLPAGQVTVGLFLIRTFGSGTMKLNASATTQTVMLVEDIGV